MRACQRFATNNDTSGNPRRTWVIYDLTDGPDACQDARIVSLIDEGYGGMPDDARGLARLPDVFLTPSFYREIVNHFKRSHG